MLRILNADLPLVPLYRRTLTWVMRPNVSVAQWPNDILELRFVQIDWTETLNNAAAPLRLSHRDPFRPRRRARPSASISPSSASAGRCS